MTRERRKKRKKQRRKNEKSDMRTEEVRSQITRGNAEAAFVDLEVTTATHRERSSADLLGPDCDWFPADPIRGRRKLPSPRKK
jgi:hypothetical protein